MSHQQPLMTSTYHKLEAKDGKSSVKAEPLEQMTASSLYSSHFSKAPHPLSGMGQHAADTSMLTGLPHLTPAPFTTHHTGHNAGFSLDEMKYHAHNSHVHQPSDYSSFAAASSSMASGHHGHVFSYPGLTSTEHSTHHHHAKLNLQAS